MLSLPDGEQARASSTRILRSLTSPISFNTADSCWLCGGRADLPKNNRTCVLRYCGRGNWALRQHTHRSYSVQGNLWNLRISSRLVHMAIFQRLVENVSVILSLTEFNTTWTEPHSKGATRRYAEQLLLLNLKRAKARTRRLPQGRPCAYNQTCRLNNIWWCAESSGLSAAPNGLTLFRNTCAGSRIFGFAPSTVVTIVRSFQAALSSLP